MSDTSDTSNSKFWAILIGINAYPAPIQPLSGCVRDVTNAEKVLTDSIDASRLNILKIATEDLNGDTLPTYDNIVGLFNHVQKHATDKDFIYFHYSGHGGRQLRSKDKNHPQREVSPENYFEALILHGNRHMKDYELGRHFDSLANTGANLFAVLDCCHSGGGDRTAYFRNARQIDHILPADPQSGDEPEDEDDGIGHRAGSVRPSYWTRVRNYTLLAACQQHQLAKECYDSDYKKNGALTLTMLTSLEALRQNGQSMTYKSLFWDIRARIGMKSATQNPKLFGIEDRDVFSHDSSHSSTRQAMVTSADSGRLYVDHGEVHGVKDGEKWAIYPRGALQLTTPVTTITIDRVEAIKASGPLPADAGNVERGCPASLVSPVYGTSLHVLVEDNELRQQLINQPAIGVELHGVDYVGATTYEIRPNDEGHQEIRDASGTHLPNSPVAPTASEIHSFLKKLAHYSRVLNTQNTKTNFEGKTDLQGEFEFREARGITTVSHGGSINLVFRNLRRLDPGTEEDRTRQNVRDTLYFSVLNLRADRLVTLCIPDAESQGEESLAVEPEKSSEQLPIDMEILETDGDVTEVTDIFKVIVTDKPCSFSSLATEHAMRGGAAGRGEFNKEFQAILRGAGSRAGRLRPVDAKWQTAQVSVTTTRNA